MARGFIYVLINPAMPDYVKVGKTTKTPEERAKELSAATGVPTPFFVAYHAAFPDCDHAELHIHRLLESRGIRKTPDREFFAATVRDVISIITEAERGLPSGPSTASVDDEDDDLAVGKAAWIDVYEQAFACETPSFEEIRSDTVASRKARKKRAFALYRKAARLGSPEAYLRLAEICVERGERDESRRYIREGAERGVLDLTTPDVARIQRLIAGVPEPSPPKDKEPWSLLGPTLYRF